MNQFLFSNNNLDYFPNNVLSCFGSFLGTTLENDQGWQVSLQAAGFYNKFETVDPNSPLHALVADAQDNPYDVFFLKHPLVITTNEAGESYTRLPESIPAAQLLNPTSQRRVIVNDYLAQQLHYALLWSGAPIKMEKWGSDQLTFNYNVAQGSGEHSEDYKFVFHHPSAPHVPAMVEGVGTQGPLDYASILVKASYENTLLKWEGVTAEQSIENVFFQNQRLKNYKFLQWDQDSRMSWTILPLTTQYHPKIIQICSSQLSEDVTGQNGCILARLAYEKTKDRYVVHNFKTPLFRSLTQTHLNSFSVELRDETYELLRLADGQPSFVQVTFKPISMSNDNMLDDILMIDSKPEQNGAAFTFNLMTPLALTDPDYDYSVGLVSLIHPAHFADISENLILHVQPGVSPAFNMILQSGSQFKRKSDLVRLLNAGVRKHRTTYNIAHPLLKFAIVQDQISVKAFQEEVKLSGPSDLFQLLGLPMQRDVGQETALTLEAQKVIKSSKTFDPALLHPAFIMVYSDFVAAGTSNAVDLPLPLLKIVALPGSSDQTMIQHDFHSPTFVKLLPQTVSSIKMELRQGDRGLVKFVEESGPTCATLQIRRTPKKKPLLS